MARSVQTEFYRRGFEEPLTGNPTRSGPFARFFQKDGAAGSTVAMRSISTSPSTVLTSLTSKDRVTKILKNELLRLKDFEPESIANGLADAARKALGLGDYSAEAKSVGAAAVLLYCPDAIPKEKRLLTWYELMHKINPYSMGPKALLLLPGVPRSIQDFLAQRITSREDAREILDAENITSPNARRTLTDTTSRIGRLIG